MLNKLCQHQFPGAALVTTQSQLCQQCMLRWTNNPWENSSWKDRWNCSINSHIFTIHWKDTCTIGYTQVTTTPSNYSSTGSSVSPSCCLHGWIEIHSVRVCVRLCVCLEILSVSSCFSVFSQYMWKCMREQKKIKQSVYMCASFHWCLTLLVLKDVLLH